MILSCTTDDVADAELLGDWTLIEIYSDPGDGSGSFSAVNSQKMVTFSSDNSITSNGVLCDISLDVTTPTTGVFSEETMTFNTEACGSLDLNYQFEIEGNTLIIYPFCIEGCGAKYRKI